MQKNKILLLILLGFGISMELVLGLYLLNRSATRHPGVSSLFQKSTLVSTIAVKIKPANPGPTQNDNSYPAPGAYPAEDFASGADAAQPVTQVTFTADATAQATPGDGALAAAQAPSHSYPAPVDPSAGGGNPSGSYPAPDTGSYGSFDHSLPNLDAPWTGATPPASGTAAPTPVTTLAPGQTRTLPAATAPAGSKTATPVLSWVGPAPTTASGTTVAPPATTVAPTSVAPYATTVAPHATTVAPTTVAPTTLVSIPAASAPQVEGLGGDPAWSAAPPLVISTTGGANQSATRVTLRSVYTRDRVYFLLTWADPTQSYLLAPWQKQTGNTWQQLSGADTYAEDQLALAWPISNPSDFAAQGCGGLCHAGSMTAPAGQVADLWQWRSVRNVAQVDDLYLDGTAVHPDPSTGGGYYNNPTRNGKAPLYMPPAGGDKTGAPGYILDADKTALVTQLFQPGDRVPSIITAPFSGDRADLTAAWQYAGGTWTLEISRKLVTGSPDDVQFSDLSQTYFFALATFDNTLAHHAVQSGASAFQFQH